MGVPENWSRAQTSSDIISEVRVWSRADIIGEVVMRECLTIPTSPHRAASFKRFGAELRRQNIRTSAMPAREVRRFTLMGESLAVSCQLRSLQLQTTGHQWRLVATGCDIPVVVRSCQPMLVYLPGDRGGWPVCNCNYRPPKPLAASKENTFHSCLPQRLLAS